MVGPAKTMKAPTLQYPYRALIVALIPPFKKEPYSNYNGPCITSAPSGKAEKEAERKETVLRNLQGPQVWGSGFRV